MPSIRSMQTSNLSLGVLNEPRGASISVTTSVLEAVEAYVNENVVHRFQVKLGLSLQESEQLFVDTKRFLLICACCNSQGPFAPTPAIDAGWHEFLMFTSDYQNFCESFFGKFVHHWPNIPGVYVKPGGVYRAYTTARQLYGADLSLNWMLADGEFTMSNCGCDGGCGGGCNG